MQFREFYEAPDAAFRVGPVEVSVRQVPLARLERTLLESAEDKLINVIRYSLTSLARTLTDLYTTHEPPERAAPDVQVIPGPSLMDTERLKKFRVAMRVPRTIAGSKLGHYLPEVVYLFAKDAAEAKDKAEKYVRTRLEPNEAQDRRFRRNFLRDVDMKHVGMRTRQVRTWPDLVQSLADLVGKRGLYIWDAFNEKDLQLILQRAKKKTFAADLAALSKPQLRLLKRVYFTLAQDPDLTPKTREMLDPGVGKAIRRARAEGEDVPPEMPGSTTPGWNYWSVFEPRTPEEEAKAVENLGTVAEVKAAGMRFGIPPADLRDAAQHEVYAARQAVEQRRRLYDDLVAAMRHMMEAHRERMAGYWRQFPDKRPRHRPLRAMLRDGHPDSREMRDAGISWGRVMEMATEGEYVDVSPVLRSQYAHGDPNDTRDAAEAEEFVWGLLAAGRPKMPPLVTFYRDALDRLLADRDARRTGRHQEPTFTPSDDPIPD